MNETFLATVKKIKENGGSCKGTRCINCPFSHLNNNTGKFCRYDSDRVSLLEACEKYIFRQDIKVGDIVTVENFSGSMLVTERGFYEDEPRCYTDEEWKVEYVGMILPTRESAFVDSENDTVIEGKVSRKVLTISSKFLKKVAKKLKVLGVSEMLAALIERGYKPDKKGYWYGDGMTFFPEMWWYCGKFQTKFDYEPWMLEEV